MLTSSVSLSAVFSAASITAFCSCISTMPVHNGHGDKANYTSVRPTTMRIYIPSCRCLSSACFCFFTDAAEVLAGTLSGRLFLELLGRACWAVPLLAAHCELCSRLYLSPLLLVQWLAWFCCGFDALRHHLLELQNDSWGRALHSR